jgi:hypothetical protein
LLTRTEEASYPLYAVRYGFVEDPKAASMLTLAREQGLELSLETESLG